MNHRLKRDQAGRCSTLAVLQLGDAVSRVCSTVTLHPLPQDTPPDGHPRPHTCTHSHLLLPLSPHRSQGPLLQLSLHLQIWTQKDSLPSSAGKKPYICSTVADGEEAQPSVSPPLRSPSPGCARCTAALHSHGSASSSGHSREGLGGGERGRVPGRGKDAGPARGTHPHLLLTSSSDAPSAPLVLIPSCTS